MKNKVLPVGKDAQAAKAAAEKTKQAKKSLAQLEHLASKSKKHLSAERKREIAKRRKENEMIQRELELMKKRHAEEEKKNATNAALAAASPSNATA